MNTNRISDIIISLTVLAVLAVPVSCDRSVEEGGCPSQEQRHPICVNCSYGAGTRGLDPIDGVNLISVGMYASYDEEAFDESTSKADGFMNNVEFRKPASGDAGDNLWFSTPECFWPFAGKVSFFPYTPWYADCELAGDYATGMAVIKYTPSSTIASQMDFCAARPMMDQTYDPEKQGAVDVTLEHCLTRIEFWADYTGTLPDPSFTVRIDEMRIRGIYATKFLRYSTEEPYFFWDARDDEYPIPPDDEVIYRLMQNTYELSDVMLDASGDAGAVRKILNPNNGRLYLLPQEMTEHAKVDIVFGFYKDGAPVTQMSTVLSLLPSGITAGTPEAAAYAWQPGETIRYSFTLDIGSSQVLNLTCSHGDWAWIEQWGEHTVIEELIQ